MKDQKLELPPWWAWPLVVLMLPVPIVLLMLFLIVMVVVMPIVGIVTLLNYPAYRRQLRKRQEEDETLRSLLRGQGRVASPAELKELQQVSAGTFLVETDSPKEARRLWWTAEDLFQQPPLDSMQDTPTNSSDWQLPEVEQFAQDCQLRFLDAKHGTAHLLEGKIQDILRMFPDTRALLLACWFEGSYEIYPMTDG